MGWGEPKLQPLDDDLHLSLMHRPTITVSLYVPKSKLIPMPAVCTGVKCTGVGDCLCSLGSLYSPSLSPSGSSPSPSISSLSSSARSFCACNEWMVLRW